MYLLLTLIALHLIPSTLQIIMDELYRNILLAFACIFVTTLLMLSSLVACLQVLLAVVLTLLNVSGMMYFWGECEVSVMSSFKLDKCLGCILVA